MFFGFASYYAMSTQLICCGRVMRKFSQLGFHKCFVCGKVYEFSPCEVKSKERAKAVKE
jgi:hypothetical protein